MDYPVWATIQSDAPTVAAALLPLVGLALGLWLFEWVSRRGIGFIRSVRMRSRAQKSRSGGGAVSTARVKRTEVQKGG